MINSNYDHVDGAMEFCQINDEKLQELVNPPALIVSLIN